MIKIKDLKVGQLFQLEGLDVNGNTVYADCTLQAYNGMNKRLWQKREVYKINL